MNIDNDNLSHWQVAIMTNIERAHRARIGWDLLVEISTQAKYWLLPPTIYFNLRTLSKQGLIEHFESIPGKYGEPDMKVYRLTKDGALKLSCAMSYEEAIERIKEESRKEGLLEMRQEAVDLVTEESTHEAEIKPFKSN